MKSLLSYPSRQVFGQRGSRSGGGAAPCLMLERVVDYCWLVEEAVSSAMGLLGWPWGRRGPSGFGARSTAEEVTAGVDATNLTAIVTGATNGIGKETARVLALRGAEVIIPARTLESGLKVKESLVDQVPSSKLHVMEMDMSSLSSVRNFARSFNSSHKHLNILMYAPPSLKH
ncbi:Short-chain dehydrogenase TIC 32, chloroplastic [Dichanthelium oligosanthes]|uniref:Short-chain dehydrogenase TIC 32, chloroplastic n=1 Tax=Dichanthelium oligosanthes TaxID=888268 RepID=A0A1E5V4R2_9POAL|nr:Short-chain dehydrogenase TIC 32, chloroplastic [Dichanthelium oligosanthes]